VPHHPLAIVAMLTLPVIVGVAVFTVVALMPWDPPSEFDPNANWGLIGLAGFGLMMGAFFGSAYGPLLVPLAVGVVVIARKRGFTRLWSCWLLVILACVATVVSYGWALNAVELP
jgi:hypothetical protein